MKRDCDNNGNEDEMSEGINQNRFKRESEMLVTCNTYLVITWEMRWDEMRCPIQFDSFIAFLKYH